MQRICRHLQRFTGHLVLASALAVPGVAQAQEPAPPPSDQAQPSAPTDANAPQRFFDSVTVSATLNPASVRETPGSVGVIDAATVQRRLIENAADLVKFEPGVYIESNLTGVGLNGFNIRGVGGNRVMTQVDGVETAEQFDFGPFNMHQFGIDLDTLKTAEIVRSAGSSLYGSDALGGVVSFFTKDPADYLPAGRRFHFGAKTLFDGRSTNGSGNVVLAGSAGSAQLSLFTSYGRGQELGNQGEIRAENSTRTAPNGQDRRTVQALGKAAFLLGEGNLLRATVEVADNDIETQAFSSRTVTTAGPTTTSVADIVANDTLRRRRLSLDQSLVNRGGLYQWSWNAYVQNSDTYQAVDEVRVMSGAGPAVTVNRHGTLDYEQNSFGGALQGRKAYLPGGHAVLFTFGGSYKHHAFDMLRDRLDLNAATGAVVPTTLILPTKYFPKSDVDESGAYVQAEMRLGRLTLVPGVRYDRFSLDADSGDRIFLASLSPAPADFAAGAVSSRLGASIQVSGAVTLHAQYAGGFRAPPYSSVNSGFTNLAGGYTSLPNPDLDAETSDNVEFGVRSVIGPVSVGVTGFWNYYDDFIQQAARGINPATRLLEYQYQNVSEVEIRGIELQGELRFTDGLSARASYAIIRGDDVTGSQNVPLNTIAPDQGVVGLLYTAPSARWGSEATVRAARGQSQATAGAGLFTPDAFAVVDVYGWTALSRDVALRFGVLNLADAKYFEWSNVRGRGAADPVIDRYSNPGVSGVVSLAYRW